MKRTSESYFVLAAYKSNQTWANITLTESPQDWILQIYSEYWAWGCHWPNCGNETFKQFLLRCEPDYLVRRLTKNARVLNAVKTAREIKAWAEEYALRGAYRGNPYTQEMAQEAAECTDKLLERHLHEPSLFLYLCTENSFMPWLYKLLSEGSVAVYENDPVCTECLAAIWPAFQEELRKEQAK